MALFPSTGKQIATNGQLVMTMLNRRKSQIFLHQDVKLWSEWPINVQIVSFDILFYCLKERTSRTLKALDSLLYMHMSVRRSIISPLETKPEIILLHHVSGPPLRCWHDNYLRRLLQEDLKMRSKFTNFQEFRWIQYFSSSLVLDSGIRNAGFCPNYTRSLLLTGASLDSVCWRVTQ